MIQLDKIVQYHKAMADPTRIRMLILLSQGELSGQELADRLKLSPATVTHHAMKLREAALLHERRDKNTIYFKLNRYFLEQNAKASVQFLFEQNMEGKEGHAVENEKLKASVLKNFFTKDGRLKHLPAQYKKKLIVLERMVSELEQGKKYAEAELNEFIKRFHEDFATIRREFIMHQFMFREQDIYELNPEAMWTRWEDVK